MFKVGDVCVGQNLTKDPAYNGVECVIIGALSLRNLRTTGWCLAYRVEWVDGEITSQRQHELRLKKPPKKQSGEQIIKSLFLDTPIKELA